ncbi:MAG: XRE family transcriptional regulator [Gammaproteobacteria bacterium]|nr:MAG: XRE family transcriptional regulator [Gammaproteobacteria bacterium]
MSGRIDYRVHEEKGRKYAVVPLDQFTALIERAGERDSLTLPHEVVARHLLEEVPLIRAWREHLGLTQADLAQRMEVSQAQIAQWESASARPRHATLKRIAAAMGLSVGQLTLSDQLASHQQA